MRAEVYAAWSHLGSYRPPPLRVEARKGGETVRRRNRNSGCCDGAGVLTVAARPGSLLAVCLDQALGEVVDGARLGQVPLGEPVAQLGLGQALVALAGLVMGLPGLLALGLAGLTCALLLGLLGLGGLLADGLLGLGGLFV